MKTDTPFLTETRYGDCSYRMLPGDLKYQDIAVSHKWYNHKFVNADLNCVFPIDRMREYAAKGTIESLSDEHYSFMGHIYKTEALIENAKKVSKRLRDIGADIVFITPA